MQNLKKKPENQELGNLKKQVEEYKNKYLRALADFQNYEKRVASEKEALIKSANLKLILRLLPFLDSLEKAEIFMKDNGLKMIKDAYIKIFSEIGLKEIDVIGKKFDPHTSEAVEIVNGDKNDHVIEVLRKGYEFNGKIIRVAQVKVSKAVNH